MGNEPLERVGEPIDRVRARLEALVKANAAPRCGARSKRTGKPCQAAAMSNGRCKVHGGKSTGPAHARGPRAQQAGNQPAIYDAKPRFFRARMVEGVISVPQLDNPRVQA
jgi:hypothetical protein